jgi:hypothetical protein
VCVCIYIYIFTHIHTKKPKVKITLIMQAYFNSKLIRCDNYIVLVKAFPFYAFKNNGEIIRTDKN